MRSRILFILAALSITFAAQAQVKIGGASPTPDANALLELESTTKGLILPRVALTNTTSFSPLSAHVQGMTVYNTAKAGDVTPGIYVNDGTKWLRAGSSGSSNMNVTTITTTPYNLLATDAIIVSEVASASQLNLPTLTSGDAGRMIFVTNNNPGGTQVLVNASPTALPFGNTINTLRGRIFYWTGTKWLGCTL